MTSDVEVELGGPEVSLVSGLEWVGGLQTQEVVGALWDGRKLVGWEQFLKKQHKALRGIMCVPGFSTTLVQHQKLWRQTFIKGEFIFSTLMAER